MTPRVCCLGDLIPGQQAVVRKLPEPGHLRQRLLEMGLVRGSRVDVLGLAPLGDPIQITVLGTHLVIRRHEADLVEVDLAETPITGTEPRFALNAPPLRDFHPEASISNPATTRTILLAGNPNSGKSTLFNLLTGEHQRVGNWPGKTVEQRQGIWRQHGIIFRIIDLPGIYSLTAYSLEEVIARDAIIHTKPDLMLVVVDAANLERHLYLVVQLLEMSLPTLVVLNMLDAAQACGTQINIPNLSAGLGTVVVPTVLNHNLGLYELKNWILQSCGAGGRTG